MRTIWTHTHFSGRFLYLAKVLEQKYQDCSFDSNTKTSLQNFFQYLEIAQEFLSCELSATTSSHSHGKLPPSFTRTPDSVSCRTWVSLLRSQEPANTIYSCSSKPEASWPIQSRIDELWSDFPLPRIQSGCYYSLLSSLSSRTLTFHHTYTCHKEE